MCPKDVDGMANSVEPAVYTVCSDLSQTRIIMGGEAGFWFECLLFYHRALQNKKNNIPDERRTELEGVVKSYYGVTTVTDDILKQAREVDYRYNMSLVTRKPVFGVFDQIRLAPACSATETS